MEKSDWYLLNRDNEVTHISRPITRVGRTSDFEMICNSKKVSRDHAQFIVYPNGTLHIQDNNSSNGTYINRRRIDPNRLHQLLINDEIGLGLHSQINADAADLDDDDLKFVFTVRKNVSNEVIVLDDTPETASIPPGLVNGVTDSPLTRDGLINLLDSEPEVNSNQNIGPSSSVLPLVNHFDRNQPSTSGNQQRNPSCTTQERRNEPSTSTYVPQRTKEEEKPSTSTFAQTSSTCEPHRKEINKSSTATPTVNHLESNPPTFKLEKKENNKQSTSALAAPSANNLEGNPTFKSERKENDTSSTSSLTVHDFQTNFTNEQQKNERYIDNYDIKQEAQTIIKQEPHHDVNIPNGNNYTVEDGCIIIDDDDEFVCSQLLFDEPTSKNVDCDFLNESIFCAIKKELEELDKPEDGRVYACVDLVDSDEEDAQDWVSDINSIENNEKTPESCQTVQQEQDNVESKPYRSSTNKYSIPPVISPHVEIKTRRSERKSEPEKRKIVEKEIENAKKIKTSSFYDTKNKRDSGWKRKRKEPVAKETKDQIQELRKKKLKEIADKKFAEIKAKATNLKTATAKVKISDSRGKFLTENIDMPSTSRTTSLRSRTTTSNNLPCPKPTTKTYTSHQNTNMVHKNTHIPQSISSVPRSVIPVLPVTRNGIKKNYEGIQDILIRFLNWKTVWFTNWKINNAPPPIHNKPLSRMSLNFSNYTEYYNTVMPLLEMELWNYMVKGFNEEGEPRNKKFLGKITTETKLDNYTELECFTYITKEQNDNLIYIKEEDAVLVQFAFKQTEPYSITIPMLGYVKEVQKKNLNERDFMDADFGKMLGINPHALVTFNILVQPYNGAVQEKKKHIHIKIISSLIPSTRIIKSVKHLESSSLCQHVLKPSLALYTLPRARQERLFSREQLNDSQYQAVMEATDVCLRKEPGIYLIQGPPGTGKSTVIINIIQQILLRELHSNSSKHYCILVVAPSNAAVDEITMRLINLKTKLEAGERKKIKLVRLGPNKMIHSAVQDYSLFELAKKNVIDTFLMCKPNTMASNEILSIQQKIAMLKENGNSPQAEFLQYNAARAELEKTCRQRMGRSWNENLRKTEHTLLEKAKIICTTLSSCVGQRMQDVFAGPSKKIQCCIVDEATQSTEQETLIPLMLGIDKMVLVGDPKQLPAVTLSKEAKDCAYGQSLFSRIMSNFENNKISNPIRMLNTQYRMHPAICEFPNNTYYDGKLKCAHSLKTRINKLKILKPYLVLNYKMEHFNSQAYSNQAEIDCVIKLLDAIVFNVRESCDYSVGIVTPYNSQKQGIKAKIRSKTFGRNISISVNTVDSFQGQEKDIMIMSCVRDYSNSFVSDEQRLNVAMTRAMHALYIIGTDSLLKSCASLGKVYDDAKRRYLIQVVSSKTSTVQLSNMIKHRR